MAGLAPQSLRQVSPLPEDADLPAISVEIDDGDPQDTPVFDAKGAILKIEHGDGSLTLSLDGSPIEDAPNDNEETGWFENLADKIAPGVLSGIAEDLLRGIEADIQSRQEWIEARATGVKLLGLTIEVPSLQGGSDGAPVEGMSKVRHPLLLESVLRFQANARSELLPTDGPVKVRNDALNNDAQKDSLSDALETDLNHYLTAIATEYYPDTDRMLFMLGFSGTQFKKVYFCPLRSRPVSETVDAADLIVNNAATDLANAKRITHSIMMRPSTVKRMQILGVYRDTDLGQALEPRLDSLKREEKTQQGIVPTSANPLDRNRQIYECYCELDIPGYEHRHNGKISGLEIPWRVTIDVSSREVLSVVRNYNEDTEDLPVARPVFVKYPFVPGLGFYDIGLLHILGNTTNALTAGLRELLDAGMFANFPGFMVAKNGTRQNTNIFRVPPGGGVQIDTGTKSLKDSVAPLPYKEPSQALIALIQYMSDMGARLGGTSEQQVGEGNAEVPVGTALAQIEQATKIMNSVHKRAHAAQADEFKLLVACFREHPESFWQRPCKSGTAWDKEMFLAALNSCELVPQADPNTASHGQRMMKVTGLMQLSANAPDLYDPVAINTAAVQALGWNNPQQFFKSPQDAQQVPPEVQKVIEELRIKGVTADAAMVEAQAQAKEVEAKIAAGAFAPKQPNAPSGGVAPQVDTPVDEMLAQAKMLDAQTKARSVDVDHQELMAEIDSRAAESQSREQIQLMELARATMKDNADARIAMHQAKTAEKTAAAAAKAAARQAEVKAAKPKAQG